jgi:hypothetical protein
MENNEHNISYCGFYCNACPLLIKGKCKGCKGNTPDCAVGYNACKVRPCCIENGYSTCAECKKYESVRDCKKFNPFMIRFGEFISRTKRTKGIEMIKEKGEQAFVDFMKEKNWVTIKLRGK